METWTSWWRAAPAAGKSAAPPAPRASAPWPRTASAGCWRATPPWRSSPGWWISPTAWPERCTGRAPCLCRLTPANMDIFAYRAMNARGHVVHGELDAANLVDLELRLKRMELDFIHGAPSRRGRLRSEEHTSELQSPKDLVC